MERSRLMSSGLSVSFQTGLPGDCVLFNIILIPSGWGAGQPGGWGAVVAGAAADFTWWATRIIWVISGGDGSFVWESHATTNPSSLRQQATPRVSNTHRHTPCQSRLLCPCLKSDVYERLVSWWTERAPSCQAPVTFKGDGDLLSPALLSALTWHIPLRLLLQEWRILTFISPATRNNTRPLRNRASGINL